MTQPGLEPGILETSQVQSTTSTNHPQRNNRASRRIQLVALVILTTFAIGFGSGYWIWGRQARESKYLSNREDELVSVIDQINPPKGYTLPARYGNIGPQVLAAGGIDLDRFLKVYEKAGRPLTNEQLAILTEGSDSLIVINKENAHFLLNFFWAVGLTNKNPILTEGPMMQDGEGKIGRFASTGGWTIGTRPAPELYASAPIVTLTPDQQALLQEVAMAVYRPCCNNPTHFPDCNHGMAMLGLLELMASQGASAEEMFTAAKYINAFWFPQQTLELAVFFKAGQDLDFAEVNARQIVGGNYSSGTGFQAVHQWLANNGLLEKVPNNGSGCGV